MTAKAPPLPGDWSQTSIAGTGVWSVGPVWYDRPAGRYALYVTPALCNAYGVLHGGALATFVDSQATAVRDYGDNDPADHTPTISLSVDYISPVPCGSWLIGDVTLLRTTRNMIFIQSVLTVAGEIVARSNAIYRNAIGKVVP